MRKRVWVAGFLGAMLTSQVAKAETYVSDQAAALLVYPLVLVGPGSGATADTVIQMSNTSTQLVAVQCYYVNATGYCSLSGSPCFASDECPSAADLCIPQWVESDFRLYITGRQPLAWRASQGLQAEDLPLNGTFTRGPTGESNAGSRVPPFQDDPGFAAGELKCYAINGDGTPSDRNVLKGEATYVVNEGVIQTDDQGQTAKHNAIGFRAIEGAVNADNRLRLGGEEAEYDGCPNVLILNHFFDFAEDPVTDNAAIFTALTLVPCTENFVNQIPTRVTVQYLVFNEFEQRFSTSAPVDCFFLNQISLIDTPDPTRSIFSVFVAGTLTGQTRIRPVNGGLTGVALELHDVDDDNNTGTFNSFNLHVQGEREGQSDILTVVAP